MFVALDHVALTLTSQAEFIEALRNEGKVLLFNIHGTLQQSMDMVKATEAMQTNFDSSPQNPKGKEVLVVPIEWACADEKGCFKHLGMVGMLHKYKTDQGGNSKAAGKALWELFSGLKKEKGSKLSLNVMAHSMGNRVLRSVGKSAIPDGDASWTKEGLQGKTLLQAAPADLQNNENLFENIFFVSADIPETVFNEPNGKHSEQAEHALQSGVAALAVMTKRMHVLHANGTDEQLNKSFMLNVLNARLGSRGPWSSTIFGGGEKANGGYGLGRGEPSKVWDKIGDALEYESIEADGSVNNSNVHVKDCSPWNTVASHNGHSYQFAPEAVAYYLEHMTKVV